MSTVTVKDPPEKLTLPPRAKGAWVRRIGLLGSRTRTEHAQALR